MLAAWRATVTTYEPVSCCRVGWQVPCEQNGELQVVGRAPALRFGLCRWQAPLAPLSNASLQVSIC